MMATIKSRACHLGMIVFDVLLLSCAALQAGDQQSENCERWNRHVCAGCRVFGSVDDWL